MQRDSRSSTNGSSPLTRGKLGKGAPRDPISGLIPAHAGKTRGAWSCRARGRAHPRSRGENGTATVVELGGDGSSPLTRGKRPNEHPDDHTQGLIPAHAGKTQSLKSARRGHRAHPRSRGENSVHAATILMAVGSSPLTRGKLDKAARLARRGGLIPAHAGKTPTGTRWTGGQGAHPRSRGENARSPIHDYTKEGSSPLTRGKRVAKKQRSGVFGLIPAHAGKTVSVIEMISPMGAHPRSRGENVAVRADSRWSSGSSPLTRGKRDTGHGFLLDQGLIPAHAGKTGLHARHPPARRAHPRSRGEN